MALTNFPGSLDSATNLPDPASGDLLGNASTALKHHTQHGTANEAIIAVETKLGITNSQDYSTPSVDLRTRVLEKADWAVTPNTMDDEFLASGSVNTGKWTWLNQGTSTTNMVKSWLVMDAPQNSSLRMLYQAMPSGTPTFEARASITMSATTQFIAAGIGLYESGTGKLAMWSRNVNSNANYVSLDQWTNTTTYNNTPIAISLGTGLGLVCPVYLRVVVGASTYTFYWSTDGAAWALGGSVNYTTFFTVKANQVGLIMESAGNDGAVREVAWDYFRRVA